MLIENILEDVEWRIYELSRIKTIPIRYNFIEGDSSYFYRLSVVSVYAIWEAFMHNVSESYLKYLNTLELTASNVDINVLTFYFDSVLNMKDGKTRHDTKKKFAKNILFVSNNKLYFNIENDFVNKWLLKSNVNYEILKDIFLHLSFDISSVNKHKNALNKLIYFRNKIAHGDNAISVGKEEIHSFIETIENIMWDILIILESTLEVKSYCKSSE